MHALLCVLISLCAPSHFGVATCSGMYWFISALSALFFLGLSWLFYTRTRREYNLKVAHGYTFVEGDFAYTPKKTAVFGWLMLFAGLMSGYLGIGAAMFIQPAMLGK